MSTQVAAEDTVKRDAAPAPRAIVRAMKEYHPPLGDRDGLRLDFNENTLACSPRVREALAAFSSADCTRYPERGPVEALVARYLQLPPEQILLTNGVDEAIHVLCQAYLDPGDELLLPVPTYSMYEVYGSAAGAAIVPVQAARADFAFPYEQVLAGISPRTRLIALANPNSPTGTPATREQMLTIAKRAPQAIVLADEAYFHFHGETVLDSIGNSAYPNLVVARTFSKAYGLAGLRLGLLAAAPGVMPWLRRVISPYSVNALALACLPPALEDMAYLDWYVGEVKAARAEFYAVCDELGVRTWPSAANFVLLEIGAKHREFTRAMHAQGILVRDRSADPGLRWLRAPHHRHPRADAACARCTAGCALHARIGKVKKTLSETANATATEQAEPSARKKASTKTSLKPGAAGKTTQPVAAPRTAVIERNTTETKIALRLTIEGTGRYTISTGIRFFDHMLELFTRHGAFDLELRCNGDLDIDQHHTIEDIGIALGEAFDKALGDKKGIHRAGYFLMPMDETLGIAAVDLSGRVACKIKTKVAVEYVGDLQSELVEDFFDGFARGARANVHLKTMYGRSNHHKLEALFKAFARALRVACSRDKQLGEMLPSTKGLL